MFYFSFLLLCFSKFFGSEKRLATHLFASEIGVNFDGVDDVIKCKHISSKAAKN